MLSLSGLAEFSQFNSLYLFNINLQQKGQIRAQKISNLIKSGLFSKTTETHNSEKKDNCGSPNP